MDRREFLKDSLMAMGSLAIASSGLLSACVGKGNKGVEKLLEQNAVWFDDMPPIGKLGFGLMRLPRNEDKSPDIEQTKKMVDIFMEAGFNYFDTAWAYGDSEDVTRQALVERYPREKFMLASKCAAWITKTRDEALAQLETSLRRTGAGYFDFYLLHNLGENRTQVYDDYGLWEWAFQMKKEGKVKHVGFSFHSNAEELEEILTKHPEAEFVQLQLNYTDWDNTAIQSRAIHEVARRHNKPIIVMEPLKGGLLANPPQKVKEVLDAAGEEVSYASWALRYAASLEGVATVLSGMSNIAQMEDNVKTIKNFSGFTKEEEQVIADAQRAFKEIAIIPCTTCNYCAKVCPNSIAIAGSFSALNSYLQYGNLRTAKEDYEWNTVEHNLNKASDCIQCGQCEEVCPQHIEIRKELQRVAQTLEV